MINRVVFVMVNSCMEVAIVNWLKDVYGRNNVCSYLSGHTNKLIYVIKNQIDISISVELRFEYELLNVRCIYIFGNSKRNFADYWSNNVAYSDQSFFEILRDRIDSHFRQCT